MLMLNVLTHFLSSDAPIHPGHCVISVYLIIPVFFSLLSAFKSEYFCYFTSHFISFIDVNILVVLSGYHKVKTGI